MRFLLIVLGGYLLFKIIGRYLLPWLGKKAVKKAQDNFKEKQERQRSGEKVYESGDITIRKGSSTKGNDDGEFTDFEEVKD